MPTLSRVSPQDNPSIMQCRQVTKTNQVQENTLEKCKWKLGHLTTDRLTDNPACENETNWIIEK